MSNRRLPAYQRKSLSKANKILFSNWPGVYADMTKAEKHYRLKKAAYAG